MGEKSVGNHWFIKVEFGDDSEFVCLPTERKMKGKKILFLSTTLFSVSWALGKWEKPNKRFYKTAAMRCGGTPHHVAFGIWAYVYYSITVAVTRTGEVSQVTSWSIQVFLCPSANEGTWSEIEVETIYQERNCMLENRRELVSDGKSSKVLGLQEHDSL